MLTDDVVAEEERPIREEEDVELATEDVGCRSSDMDGVIGDCRLGIEMAGLARLAGDGIIPGGLVSAGEGRETPKNPK